MTVDDRVFPWAAEYDADQLAAFIEDLWGAASGDNDLATLQAVEDAIAAHRPAADLPAPCPLTEREVEILTLLASGATYASAGQKLNVTDHSVRRHAERIYDRLGVRNAAHAVSVAAHHRWLPDLPIPEPVARMPRAGPHTRLAMYQERAAEMRGRPGEPAEIGPYGSIAAVKNAAYRINRGLVNAFKPAGSFRAQAVRSDSGQWFVRARYLGTPVRTTERTTS
ncbi:helix-turn-helix transcriptional regulator [Streptomyces sp. NBC_00996]|uniref:helix-turn-helix domain-containing protein n=1 Tax=Streptomyces sp. NBC_00996 TaxID=2903710 RepID=UPI003864C188|nr:helix-turn-helix transcriptional regulator [Streptomyces sp. NBC_00996]